MGGPEMAPHTPPSASRSSQRLDRACDPEMAPDTPPPASRSSHGLDRACDVTPVITQPHVCAHAELHGLERDALVLTSEERRWGRRRVKTTAGRELVLALPPGSVLNPGQILDIGT